MRSVRRGLGDECAHADPEQGQGEGWPLGHRLLRREDRRERAFGRPLESQRRIQAGGAAAEDPPRGDLCGAAECLCDAPWAREVEKSPEESDG